MFGRGVRSYLDQEVNMYLGDFFGFVFLKGNVVASGKEYSSLHVDAHIVFYEISL